MVFIAGTNIIESRAVVAALKSFYGIGPLLSAQLMAKLSIHRTATLGELPTAKVNALNNELAGLTLENDLRRKIRDDIHRLKDIGSHRGRRHAQNLPVRGQRTRSQIATARKLNKLERRG